MIAYHLASRTIGRTRCGLAMTGTPHLSKVECHRCLELSTQPEYAALDEYLRSRSPLTANKRAASTCGEVGDHSTRGASGIAHEASVVPEAVALSGRSAA